MRLVIGSVGIALAALLFQAALAGAHGGGGNCGCEKCGCEECDITCRLVCETKKVPKVCYCCKCEPFCVAHPCPGHQVHECEAPQCECENDCCHHECGAELWLKDLFHCDNAHADSADSFHKKKLIKYVDQKEERVYKWVAEKHCPHCGCCSECACGCGTPNATMPPAPAHTAPTDAPMPPAPMGKSTSANHAVNMPAGFTANDDASLPADPVFRTFYNK